MNSVRWYIYPYNPHISIHDAGSSADTPRRLSALNTYPILSDHPVVSRWDAISEHIIELLDSVGIQWLAVDCFQRRQSYQPNEDVDSTTILITIQKFPYISTRFKKILQDIHEYSGGLFIELLGGKIWCGTTEAHNQTYNPSRPWVSYGGNLSANAYSAITGIEKSPGDFSCYLLLSNNCLEVKKCGLTCHHFVRPCKGGIPSTRESRPITEDAGKYIRIRRPYFQDYIRESLATGQTNALEPRLANEQNSSIESMHRRHEVASEAGVIGIVLASSGLSISDEENCQLDWALVDLHPENFGKNVIVNTGSENITICHWSRPTRNRCVYLPGAKFSGYINSVKSYVCNRLAHQEMRTREWAVVGGVQGMLIKPGDAGSLVVGESNNEAIGVVWGGIVYGRLLYRGPAYITPLHAIVKSIRERTGYSVCLAGGFDEIA